MFKFARVAYARQSFLNLRKPNPLLPVVVVACLRETTPTFDLQPTVHKGGTLVLESGLPISRRFNLAIGWALT